MIVISDTSVITSLIHIGRAGLLKDLYHTVVIPTAVSGELHAHPHANARVSRSQLE